MIVSRTFSKIYGLAGLRVGYGLANADLAQRLRSFRMTWLNHISIRAALASYQDQAFVEQSRIRNNEVRRQFLTEVDQLKLPYAPTDANFVWLNIGPGCSDLGDRMKQFNILLGNPRPPESDWVRVTIGTRTEMAEFTRALRSIIGARP